LKILVADAVQVEPVSTAKFPANREKNREFYRTAVSVASETVNNGVVLQGFRNEFPTQQNRDYFGGTGNLGARIGNFLDQN
jgi:hypothetical protein